MNPSEQSPETRALAELLWEANQRGVVGGVEALAEWLIARGVSVRAGEGAPMEPKKCSCCGNDFYPQSGIIACCGCCVGKPTGRLRAGEGAPGPVEAVAPRAPEPETWFEKRKRENYCDTCDRPYIGHHSHDGWCLNATKLGDCI